MAKNDLISSLTYENIIELYAEHGGERAAARFLSVPRTTLQDHFKKLKASRFLEQRTANPVAFPAKSEVQTFILSSAQDGTKVHKGFLTNLEAYAVFKDAEIMISGFTYNKKLFEDHDKHHARYPQEIGPYLVQERVNFGEGLAFCGEMNTLPTAVQPLSGFDSYTKERWGIFPHTRIHLKSVPTVKSDVAKIIMTTGTVTLPNYVQKKAGLKAEFNHQIAAVIVELLPTGEFFCRHLVAEEDGSFQDLTNYVAQGEVTPNCQVKAIGWGDIHLEKKDSTIFAACWDSESFSASHGCMLDDLMPDVQFMHDVIDFEPRNHHNIKDPHFLFKMHKKGTDSVEDSVNNVADFLSSVSRDWCKTVIVEANHDLALLKWLKTCDYRDDPVNALYFLTLQKKMYEEIAAGNDNFQILPWAIMAVEGIDLEATFLSEDDSYIVSDIECALHGHNGAGGSRGSSTQFAKIGKKSNTGHTHSAAILDGNYCAGVSGQLDMGYNKGLSSWSHTHIVTYESGKRTLVTQLPNGIFCADAYLSSLLAA